MSQYLLGDDLLVEELLRAQRPPPRWVVYRVQLYRQHGFVAHEPERPDRCRHCGMRIQAHYGHELRQVTLLVNGPLRRLVVLTDEERELPRVARMWLNTLHNVAEAANTRINGWIAYDGRG